MKVSVKDFNITMDLGNEGITFDIYDTADKFLGDLRLGRGTIEWCKGKVRAGNGIKVRWPDLIAFLESQAPAAPAKKPAVKKTTTKAPSKKVVP